MDACSCAEVNNFDGPIWQPHYVLWFQVAMDNPLFMHYHHGSGNLQRDVNDFCFCWGDIVLLRHEKENQYHLPLILTRTQDTYMADTIAGGLLVDRPWPLTYTCLSCIEV
jgi:hypothetical protein